jgi:NodT family efflux transporter outer membrane factor (OMF) lipoprotein
VIIVPSRRGLLAALLGGAALCGLLGGCTVGPDFEQPAPWYNPSSWFAGRPPKVETGPAVSEEVAAPVDPQWWKLFGDPQLTGLEQRLADGNLDIRVQTIRLAQSRASLGIARADAFPQVNGNANYTREQQSSKGVISLLGGSGSPATGTNGAAGTSGGIPSSLKQPFSLFQYGFDASWEIDFWGRVRRNVESADATVTAGQESERDALVTAQAELARDYLQLRGTQRQIQITQQNLDTARQSLSLTQERASGGLTTDLDVAQAAALVSTTAAQLPGLQTQEAQLMNAIALLLGQQPNSMTAELRTAKPIPPVPPTIPVGLPSELARRRPDIRRAEAQLHAATATVGVAVADFYPRVTLSGSAAIQAVNASDLANWAAKSYSIGPGITLPIFEGGRLRRTLELRKAQEQEAAVAYQQTVLNALHDVDNALTAYDNEQRRRAQLTQAVAQSQRQLSLARDRYTQGIADFLSVLDAQRTLLSAQQQLTDSTTTISTNLVQLYKALGGGWEDVFPDTPALAKDGAAAGAKQESAGL